MESAPNLQQPLWFKELRAANHRIFSFAIGQLFCVVLLTFIVFLNQNRFDSFMGDGGPWGLCALQSLDAITPETEREAYILSVLRKLVPLPIIAVKNSFVYSTLLWLIVMALVVIGFTIHQRKMLDEFQRFLNR